ncbi:hypothetical protein BGW42_006385 [Actinomortierella wolfii]|nr:hypothetical protein BGW42_006385 [Actinomortierella wolfii]
MDWIGAFPADHETLCRQPWARPAVSDPKGQRDAHATSSTSTCSTRDQDARKDSLVAVAPVSGNVPRPALHYNTSKTSTLTKHRAKKSEDSLHTTKSIGPNTSLAVDRVWAIWQAFQQTQMKPDIVLFTTLMNILAKAKQFDKADQIWDTMMMASTSQLNTAGRGGSGGGERRGHGDKASHHFCDSRLMAVTGHISGPNLETFSVLLQAYASRNDIDGVASVYQEIKKKQQQHPPRFSKPPLLPSISETGTAPSALTTTKKQLQSLSDVNTVLLNQILRLLVNVGENKAAREIFEEMERSVVTKEDGVVKEGKSSHAVYSAQAKVESQELASLPRHRSHHHETFARRAFWRANKTQRSQEWKKQQELQQKPEQPSPSVASMALEPRRTTVSGKTGPDAHTVEIMLELARKEGDSAFEARLQTLLDKCQQQPLP